MLPDIATRVIDLAVTAPSADNSQPWRFIQQDNYWDVCYCHTGANDPFGPTGHATLLSTGALCSNLELICGRPNTYSTIDPFGNWHLSFTPPQHICETTEALLRQRHTNRHPFIGPVEETICSQIELSESLKVQLVLDRSSIRQIAKATRICSELRFNTQELHEWLFSSLRWTESEIATGDGLDINTLHLPAGGNAFMKFISSWSRMSILNSLGISKCMALIDSKPIRNAPALIVISSRPEPGLAWQAGKTLAQLWANLNQRGLAVHPYYVITDMTYRYLSKKLTASAEFQAKSALEITRHALNLDTNEVPHIVLRIGIPTITPVRSRRKTAELFIKKSNGGGIKHLTAASQESA